MFKKMASNILRGNVNDNVNIYCNDVVYEAIINVAKYTLPDNLLNKVYKNINFVVLNDNDKYMINGVEYEFFDILARGDKQFGFECLLMIKSWCF